MKDVSRSQLVAHLQKAIDRRMVERDVEISETVPYHALCRQFRLHVDRQAQGLEHTCIPRATVYPIIPMHQHRCACGCRNHCSGSKGMEGVLFPRIARQIYNAEFSRDWDGRHV